MSTHFQIDINGPANVVSHGGSGRPILLVHGLGGSHVNWTAVGQSLTSHGSVRAIDLVGFGHTPLAGRNASVQSQRDFVIEYLKGHADAPAVLVGNSMGGLISLLVARKAPELVDSLVLVDAALPTVRLRFDPQVIKGLLRPIVPVLGARAYEKAMQDPKAYMEEAGKMLFVDSSRMPEEARRQSLAMAAERSKMPWVSQAFSEAAKSMFGVLMRRRSFATDMQAIDARALIVQGECDRLVDVESARWLAGLRPDWQLEVFEDIGHVPMLEAPERFVAVVGEWLARNAAPVS